MAPAKPAVIARPFMILATTLFCEITAGFLYWWPALQPGLTHHLSLTPSQSTILIATANSGSVLGILSGLFHDRFGSRVTASVSVAGIVVSFVILFSLVAAPLPDFIKAHAFSVCFVVIVNLITLVYGLYSAAMTAAVSVFSQEYRGRVVGLCSSMYGGSAAVFAAIQAAFFPTLNDTKGLLIFIMCFASIGVILTATVFKDPKYFDVEVTRTSTWGGYQSITENTGRENVRASGSVKGMGLCYQVCWLLVICLQFCALAQALDMSLQIIRVCSISVIVAILCFALLPLRNAYTVKEKTEIHPGQAIETLQPLAEVLKDARYLYVCMGFFSIIGGGGVAILVQAQPLIVSRIYSEITGKTVWDPELVSGMVRTLVMVFAAGNVTGRLAVGSIADRGDSDMERLMWKYDIMVWDAFLLMIALFGIAFGNLSVLYISAGIVGLCHGTFFTMSPALTTLWFGVQSFPRNFAVYGCFLAVATASISSSIPTFLRDNLGHWTEIPKLHSLSGAVENICTGLLCSAPPFGLIAFILLGVFLFGRFILRPVVKSKALNSYV